MTKKEIEDMLKNIDARELEEELLKASEETKRASEELERMCAPKKEQLERMITI